MDRKIKRNDFNYKKINYKVKDSGDSKKPFKSEGNMKVIYLERGDSGERKISATNKKSQQMNEDTKPKYLIYGTAEKDMARKNDDKGVMGKSYSEIRKRIRDKYTFKYNVPVNKSDHLSLYKSSKGGKVTLNSDGYNRPIIIRVPTDPVKSPIKPLPEETSRINEKQIRSSSGQSDFDKKSDSIPETKPEKIPETKPEKIPETKPEKIPETKPEKIPEIKPEKITVRPDKLIPKPRWRVNSPKKRRPIIKTVVSKTDTARIFKAVTFVDNVNCTPLEIKIPGEEITIKKQQKVSKYTETTPLKFKSKPSLPTVRTIKSKPSKEYIKIEEKPTPAPAVVRKRRHRACRNMSPSSPLEPACPPTEVAKWLPASVDPQTKPYYEAWVDTTLTATSKHNKKDKTLYDYQMRLIKSFKRAMERQPSPELFYEKFADERYAGRIKIKQSERRRRT